MFAAILAALLMSAFLPNQLILTDEEFTRLRERPILFALSERFSTPRLVASPFFQIACLFLGVSTVLCTARRLRAASRRRDFSKRRAFSASVTGEPGNRDARKGLLEFLEEKGWRHREEKGGRGVVLVHACKGEYGYWGSIMFHVALVLAFSGGVISSATRFNGELVAPVGVEMSTAPEAFVTRSGETRMPAYSLLVKEVSARFEGRKPVKLDGRLLLDGREFEFAVNKPFSHEGYQFSAARYGISPQFVLRKNGVTVFDSYVNLRSMFIDDYFDVPGEGIRINVRYFPDYFREGSRFGTRTMEEKNPVFYLRVSGAGAGAGRYFMSKGESVSFNGYELSIAECTHWAGIIASRDSGMAVFMASFVLMLAGLGIRFLSNERQVSGLFYPDGSFELRGWSRYYPAFLEREVESIRNEIRGG